MRVLCLCVVVAFAWFFPGCSDEDSMPPEVSGSSTHRDNSAEEARRATESDDLVSAESLRTAALQAAREEDPEARMVSADYKAGGRDLRFQSATFHFNSPALKAAGERKTSLRVQTEGAKVTRVRPLPYHWVENPDYDLDPSRAFQAAMKSEFNEWWEKHPEANLYMQLRHDSDYMDYRPQKSEWVWVVMGSGPGVPEDCKVYIEEGNFQVLGTKRKEVSTP